MMADHGQSQGSNVDLSRVMRERVERHMKRFPQNYKARNPAIPDDIFDFSRSGLPKDFEYHPVEVPNPSSPLYASQLGTLNNYLQSGFEFLTDEMVTRDGRNGTAMIPDFVEIDGKVMVGGCYILYADRDWYGANRRRNVEKRNAILTRKSEAREDELEAHMGNRQVRKVESDRRDATLDELMSEEGTAGTDDRSRE